MKNETFNLVCAHADTCLADYWRGHHLPHISYPVCKNMTLGELKYWLIDELKSGAIAGADFEKYQNNEAWFESAESAINSMSVPDSNLGDDTPLFTELDESTKDGMSDEPWVYAYFVFIDE